MPICSTCTIELTDLTKVKGRNKCYTCFRAMRNAQNRNWNENNPTKQSEYDAKCALNTTTCACGKVFRNQKRKRHLESKFHTDFINLPVPPRQIATQA